MCCNKDDVVSMVETQLFSKWELKKVQELYNLLVDTSAHKQVLSSLKMVMTCIESLTYFNFIYQITKSEISMSNKIRSDLDILILQLKLMSKKSTDDTLQHYVQVFIIKYYSKAP